MFYFSNVSKKNLYGIDPDLIAIAYRALALSPYDFAIIEGLRSEARQRELVKAGKSQIMHSHHLTGNAFDFAVYVDGRITWDLRYYRDVAKAMKKAAAEYKINITWGGDWQSFVDGPHIQLET